MKQFFTVILLCFSLTAFSQNDGVDVQLKQQDSLSIFRFNTNNPTPKRAGLYSALLPGLGQVYNKQYWKLGLVVAGIASAAYFIDFNNTEYQRFRNAYIARIDNDPTTIDEFVGIYQNNDLNTQQQQYRQWLEYTVVFTTVGYAMNILDAYIAANLKSFDINEDITFHTKPTFENQQLGLALVIKMK